jgi:putative tryptophan/tyrosine transport system substrate-binding protein
MTVTIGRRELLAALSGAAAAWPLAARAQQPAVPVVGWLNSETPSGYAPMVAAFRQGLSEAGFVEGRNVTIEYRWAQGHNDRLPALAAELVRRPVAVLAAAGTPSALAAKAATTTIPIVFSTAADPVGEGLVVSLSRPGGNTTGVTNLGAELVQKEMEMLHQMVPTATVIVALVNPTNPALAEPATKDVQAAARTLGLQAHVIQASSERDIDTAFATLVRLRAGALLVCPDAFLLSRRDQIAALALRHAKPAIYFQREFAAAGGLMSYGPSVPDGYRQIGIYAGRILKGERPGDLPVQQSTKLDLVINLTTAKALGLDVPFYLQQLADEVIE